MCHMNQIVCYHHAILDKIIETSSLENMDKPNEPRHVISYNVAF